MATSKKRTTSKMLAQLRKAGVGPSEAPSRAVFISNSSVLCGVPAELLEELLLQYDANCEVIVYPTSKSYSFALFSTVEAAQRAHAELDGSRPDGFPQDIRLAYIDGVPTITPTSPMGGGPVIEGLHVLEDFITEAEETHLLKFIEKELARGTNSLKNRRVLHYGYAFDYSINAALEPCEPIPECFLTCIKKCSAKPLLRPHGLSQSIITSFSSPATSLAPTMLPDQVTVNVYEPGQGIPPHTDTHSAFEEQILSLSLLSPVVMEFRDGAGPSSTPVGILLPRRSLLVMEGAARYRYKHGILSRKHDINPVDNHLLARRRRISITYRRCRRPRSDDPTLDRCQCPYPELCDWDRGGRMAVPSTPLEALRCEREYVAATYDRIAPHFDETRVANWPAVADFLDSLSEGSVVLDAGCGNGKYLVRKDQRRLVMLGCDLCLPLLHTAKVKCERKRQSHHDQSPITDLAAADALQLPYKSDSMDACLSIAVVHHFSTEERRLRALQELARVLRRGGGRAIITVWAMEQCRVGELSENGGDGAMGDTMSVYAASRAKKTNAAQESQYIQMESMDRETKENENGESASVKKQLKNEKEVVPVEQLLRVHDGGGVFAQQDLLISWQMPANSKGVDDKQGDASTAGDAGKGCRGKEEKEEESHEEKQCGASGNSPQKSTKSSASTTGGSTHYRYYHLFKEGELERLVAMLNQAEDADGGSGPGQGSCNSPSKVKIKLVSSFYEEGNWIAIVEKQ